MFVACFLSLLFTLGIPAAAEIIDLPVETDKVNTTLKWKEAQNNGASITEYTVYRRTINEDGTAQEWIKLNVNDPSDRKVVVTLQKGKVYEFVVTATNSFGEGAKEERKIKTITVLGGRCIQKSQFQFTLCTYLLDCHTFTS